MRNWPKELLESRRLRREFKATAALATEKNIATIKALVAEITVVQLPSPGPQDTWWRPEVLAAIKENYDPEAGYVLVRQEDGSMLPVRNSYVPKGKVIEVRY